MFDLSKPTCPFDISLFCFFLYQMSGTKYQKKKKKKKNFFEKEDGWCKINMKTK